MRKTITTKTPTRMRTTTITTTTATTTTVLKTNFENIVQITSRLEWMAVAEISENPLGADAVWSWMVIVVTATMRGNISSQDSSSSSSSSTGESLKQMIILRLEGFFVQTAIAPSFGERRHLAGISARFFRIYKQINRQGEIGLIQLIICEKQLY